MNSFNVGLMAIGTMVMVVYMSLKVTSNQSGFGDYVTYRTIVRDASGIFPKTPIKVAGINAGRIKRIELQQNNALITFEVLKKVKITKDSKLRIKTVGFLGDKFLEIYIGNSAERLTESSLLVSEEAGGVEGLVQNAGDVLLDVKVIINSLKDSLAPDGRPSPLKTILTDLEELVANTKKATTTLNSVMGDNEKRINDMIKNFESFSMQLAQQVDATQEGSAMGDVKGILANANRMTKDLELIVANIKKGRGTIGKLLVEDDIADEVKETLSGIKKIVGKVDALRTELSVYTGVNTVYGSETNVGLKIFPSPERFYQIGLTTSEFGIENEIHTTTIVGGATTDEIRKTRKKDGLRFSAQLGRKIHNWSFRGGLIESSGGVGVDYFLSRFGALVSAELFDYRKDIGINMRLITQFRLWNVFYGKLAFEDVLLDNRSGTISVGLKFNDEDLKGLLGFFL